MGVNAFQANQGTQSNLLTDNTGGASGTLIPVMKLSTDGQGTFTAGGIWNGNVGVSSGTINNIASGTVVVQGNIGSGGAFNNSVNPVLIAGEDYGLGTNAVISPLKVNNSGQIFADVIDRSTRVLGSITGGSIVVTAGTINTGTINLGTITGKDANAVAQTGNPVSIGGTDSGGTVRTVLVNSAGALSVTGASAGTFVNLSTGTLNVGTINTGTFVMTSGTLNVGTATVTGKDANAAAQTGNPIGIGGTDSGGTIRTVLVDSTGAMKVSGASAGTFVNLTTGTLNAGTINLGTVVGKDANAAAQTGNPIAIGGTDSGGTVRTVLVNSAGAMSVSGASSGTFNNISTGTMQTLGTVGTIQNILAGTISGLQNGTITAGSIVVTTGTVIGNGGSMISYGPAAAAAAATGNPLNIGGTDSGGTIRTIKVDSGGLQRIGIDSGTISVLPNLPQGSINVTAGTFVMTSGTLNVGTAVMPSGTLNVGTINTGTINLGTITGKDANAVAQTGNPVSIGGTDSGGTVRTVLVNSAGALSVTGASAGTFVNLSTGTLNAGTVIVNNGTASPVNIRILDPSGANVGDAGNNALRTVVVGAIDVSSVNEISILDLGTITGKDANAVAQTGNPIAFGGTDSGGTIRTVLVDSTGALKTTATLSSGTVVTVDHGSIVVTAGTIAAGTVHLAGTITDNFTGLGTFTITLGTLASSGSVGRQSTLVDNTANLWPAALIGCQITPGTVTAAGQVNVYLIRSDNGGGPIQDDLTGASDALGTVNNAPLLGIIPINIGTNSMYKAVYDTSFLGHLGPKFGVMVQHALGNPFAVAGSQSITYQSIMPKFS